MLILKKAQNRAKIMATNLNKAEKQILSQLEKAELKAVAKVFEAKGFPSRRVEEYHYTDLKMLIDDIPNLGEKAQNIGAPTLEIAGAYHILIVNGEVQITSNPPKGVSVRTDMGGIASDNDDVIIQLNSALTKETLVLDLQDQVDRVIHIDRRGEGNASHINGAVEISIFNDSSATIIETFSGSDAAHFSNSVSKVSLGKNAKVTHIMVDLSSKNSRHFQTVSYELEENILLRSLIIHSGSNLARTQLFANFNGENSHADLSGMMLAEKDQHSDITINVNHAVPNTTSSEIFKSVVRDNAKAIFQGKIIVAKDAQKTDAKMMTQGLMLSDDAQILSKPELEIFADDVICGHGATCGELDETSLFYLMSRGIPIDQAKSMLVRAFLAEIFDPIAGDELKDALISISDSWLA
jgi:Fe-S cluster assembly protein SufD